MRKSFVRFISPILLAVFILACVVIPALAAHGGVMMVESGLRLQASEGTGSVTVTKNVYESFKDQALQALQPGNDKFKITAIITPPKGFSLPEFGDTRIKDLKGGEYQFELSMGESVTFEDLPVGTSFSVYEDPANRSFAVTYAVDGKNTNTFTVENKKHLVEVNNDFRITPCDYSTITVTKVVEGNGAPAEAEFEFLITFRNAAEIFGISDEDPKKEGIQHSFTIKYNENGTANSHMFTGIPTGTIVTLQEITTGYSSTISVNDEKNTDTADTTNKGNCEFTFICTNTYTPPSDPPTDPPDPPTTSPPSPTPSSPPSPTPSTTPSTTPSPTPSTTPSGEEIDVTDPSVPLDPPPSEGGATPSGGASDLPYTGGRNDSWFIGIIGAGFLVAGLVLGKNIRK